MEKCYKITMTVINDQGEYGDGKESHSFIKFGNDAEIARIKALIDISKPFPVSNGWKYEGISVEKKSRQEVEDSLINGTPL
jgi:hypothetical protein